MENLFYEHQGVQGFPELHGENTEPKRSKTVHKDVRTVVCIWAGFLRMENHVSLKHPTIGD